MNWGTRKILLFLLTVLTAAGCFVGCSSEPKNPVEAKYDTLDYENYVVITDAYHDIPDVQMLIISTFDEYEEIAIDGILKDEGFFDENSLLVVKYTHSKENDPIDLVDIAIKDGKLYPVVLMELAPDQNITAGMDATLYVVDVKKSDVERYALGEVLAINLADETRGSQYHERFE